MGNWVLRGAAFSLPLVFLPNIVDEFVLPKLLVIRLLALALVVILVARWVRQGAIVWRRTALDLPLLAFIGSAVISSILAVNHNVAIFGTYDRWEGMVTILTYAVVFWLAVQLISSEADARAITWSLLISAYLVGAAAILQSAFGLLGGGYFHDGANGPIRADVTLANPDFTGIFLAMLIPVAFAKLVSRRPITTKALAANLVLVLALGLLATFTRAAWIGAIAGVVIVLVLRRGRFHLWPLVISVAVVVIGFAGIAGIVASRASSGHGGFANALAARVVSITDLQSGTAATRLRTWADTLPLVAARPVFGWGPDTFGLVYPLYETTNKFGVLWDKPHQEALGVAASQGLIGLAAYVWILISFVRAFWQGRQRRGAVALFGGWIAYEIAIQADFSWLPTSAPFWLFAACAIATWAPETRLIRVAEFPRRAAVPILAATCFAMALLLVPAVAFPYFGDASYYDAQAATDLQSARAIISQARVLAPYEAVYAVEAGNFALNLDQNGNPSPQADWTAAREAYDTAADLGSYSPEMFRHLALVDEHLGFHSDALRAARRAVELDRFDPDSQRVLAALSQH